MKTIIITLFAITLYSCSDNEVMPKAEAYTFNVFAQDGKPVIAKINWGVNSVEYSDKIDNSGYASVCYLLPADRIILSVDSKTSDFAVIFFYEEKEVKRKPIVSGHVYQFDSRLN